MAGHQDGRQDARQDDGTKAAVYKRYIPVIYLSGQLANRDAPSQIGYNCTKIKYN